MSAATGDRIVVETDDAAYAQMEEHRDLTKITATRNPVTGPVHGGEHVIAGAALGTTFRASTARLEELAPALATFR